MRLAMKASLESAQLDEKAKQKDKEQPAPEAEEKK